MGIARAADNTGLSATPTLMGSDISSDLPPKSMNSRIQGRNIASLLHDQVKIATTKVQEMQDHGMVPVEETTPPKPTKRKPASRKLLKNQTQENNVKGAQEVMRPSKRNSKNEAPQIFQQQEKSTSDSLPDSSTGNQYRSLRRKYLLLEEESFNLGRETREIQDAVKSLEEEKLSLLDELVVLEGLVDPSELDASRRLP